MSIALQLRRLAREPVLLIAADFDGTLAPIVPDPAAAQADHRALDALRALAAMPQTHAAIISGRSLSDLASRTCGAGNLLLVGSHGQEFEPGATTSLAPETRALLDRLREFLHRIVDAMAGLKIEEKPTSLALHYRNAEDHVVRLALDDILKGPGIWPGVYLRRGKKVIELGVTRTNKGAALLRLRKRVAATAVLFVGDDLTDEDVFATPGASDVGIKVGRGESTARFRVGGTSDVTCMLARLSELRGEWVSRANAVPVHYSPPLSDQHIVVPSESRLGYVGPSRLNGGLSHGCRTKTERATKPGD